MKPRDMPETGLSGSIPSLDYGILELKFQAGPVFCLIKITLVRGTCGECD